MSLHVLIAVRDATVLEYYRVFLAWEGHTVETAKTGISCMARMRSEVPDLLVLDSDLLWGGEAGVLAGMREDPDLAAVPVMVLTNRPEDGDIACADYPPIRAYLPKPLSPQGLGRAIRQLAAAPREPATAASASWFG